jgi:hypothetical protein
MAKKGRIEPVNLTTGQAPRESQRYASKRQYRRVFT